MKRSELGVLFGVVLTGFVCLHCGNGETGNGEGEGSTASAMISSISSNYGMTTFGGPGDYQSMACGGNSKTANKWYVASSQRYGCHQHLKLTTPSGKCVVVSTEDAGPATFVEKDAGKPILDSSPAVAEFLFNVSSLGWSDVKAHPSTYSVTAAKTTDAVGPCSGSSSSSSSGSVSSADDDDDDNTGDDDDNSVSSNDDDDDDSIGSAPAGDGQKCGNDGQCNPGNDGAGLICTGGFCVPGCRTATQCPGSSKCVSGQCE